MLMANEHLNEEESFLNPLRSLQRIADIVDRPVADEQYGHHTNQNDIYLKYKIKSNR